MLQGGAYVLLEIKPGLSACEASALPAVLVFYPNKYHDCFFSWFYFGPFDCVQVLLLTDFSGIIASSAQRTIFHVRIELASAACKASAFDLYIQF